MIMMVLGMYCNAQLSIQLVVNPTPPAKLSEWAVKGNTVILIATNTTPVPRKVFIHSEIKTINKYTKIALVGKSNTNISLRFFLDNHICNTNNKLQTMITTCFGK